MRREPKKYLHDMLDRAQTVTGFIQGRSLEELESDRFFRSAVERELMVIGEALYQLYEAAPDVAEQISSCRQIIGFRHVLVHGYYSIRTEILWQTIVEDIPLLTEQLKGLLSDLR